MRIPSALAHLIVLVVVSSCASLPEEPLPAANYDPQLDSGLQSGKTKYKIIIDSLIARGGHRGSGTSIHWMSSGPRRAVF